MRWLVITYTCVAVLTFGYAAGMWPLYWSWEAFDLGRSALEPADD